MNKLPEKLNLLRKTSGFSQGEIAQKLMVPVSEYMNWENGNSIPTIYQLKDLSDLFHVDVAALLDNTMSFVAPQNISRQNASAEDSVTIPFASNGAINATQQLTGTALSSADEATKEADVYSTKVMDAGALSSADRKMDDEDYDDDDEDDEEEEMAEKPKRTVKLKRSSIFQDKKKMMILGGAVAGIVVLALVLVLARNLFSGGSKLTLSDVNRLSLGDTYSMYIDKNGSIKARGQGYSTSALSGSVQISTYSTWSLGLKADGTVASTNNAIDVSDWNNITQIAAGADHAVGLREDGSVVCTGNASACNVGDWQNVASVYAGDGVTVALTEGGTFLSSGGVSIPSSAAGVKDVSISDNGVYYVTSSGTVSSISLNGATVQATTGMNNVTKIAAGDSLVAGLKKDGTVTVVSDNADIQNAVAGWKNIRYIAAKGNTLIAMTADGKMYGAGDNTYGQYENSADEDGSTASPTPSASAEASAQLSRVSNITFTETTENVQIKWDAVKNADYYEISVEPDIMSATKSQSTSASIPASSLTSGTSYTVTITAKANDSEQYPDSDPSTINYTYNAKTIQLNTPTGLSTKMDSGGAWIISWNPVENAEYYVISLDGETVDQTTQTSYTLSTDNLLAGHAYTVSVSAGSSDAKYSASVPYQIQSTYEGLSYSVTLNYSNGKSETVSLKKGSYVLKDIVTAVSADKLADPDEEIDVKGNQTVNVALKASSTAAPSGTGN